MLNGTIALDNPSIDQNFRLTGRHKKIWHDTGNTGNELESFEALH
jgi:hypothetical protein